MTPKTEANPKPAKENHAMTALTDYTETRLLALDKAHQTGNVNTPFKTARYNQIKNSILSEIYALVPDLKNRHMENNGLYYLWLALARITREENEKEKVILNQMRANMQTAHNQLKNWK